MKYSANVGNDAERYVMVPGGEDLEAISYRRDPAAKENDGIEGHEIDDLLVVHGGNHPAGGGVGFDAFDRAQAEDGDGVEDENDEEVAEERQVQCH